MDLETAPEVQIAEEKKVPRSGLPGTISDSRGNRHPSPPHQ